MLNDIPSQSQESTTVPNNYIGRICVSTELPNREICVVGDADDKEANDSDKYEPENKNDEKTGQVESTEEDEKMDTSDISMVVDEDVKLTEKQETNVEENAHVEVISSSIENKTNLNTKSNVDVDKKDNEIKSLEETCEKSTEEKMETELIEKENDSRTDDKEKISEDVRKIGRSIEEKEKSCKYEEDIVDDKLWPDVDKDLGDLLREAELSDRSSDEGEENSKTVVNSLEKNKLKMRKRYNKHKKKLCKSGDLVMVRSAIPSTGQSRKLEPKYRGPYTVVNSIGNDRYLVDDIEGERQSGHIYKGILSSDRLRLVPKYCNNLYCNVLLT